MWQRRSWFSLKGKAGIPGQTEGRPATSIGPRVPPVGSLQQRVRLPQADQLVNLGLAVGFVRSLDDEHAPLSLRARRFELAKANVDSPQGDSVLRVGIGVSVIHALGDGRWRL